MLGVEMKFYVFCIEENEGRKNEKLTQQQRRRRRRRRDLLMQRFSCLENHINSKDSKRERGKKNKNLWTT
jgi:SLT domain-containing protein